MTTHAATHYPPCGRNITLHGPTSNPNEAFSLQATHVLNTPLTSIKAFAQILLANPALGADERQRYLRIVLEEANRLSRAIDDVLGLCNQQGSAYATFNAISECPRETPNTTGLRTGDSVV